MDNSREIEQFWQDFLRETKRPSDTSYYEAFYFGRGEELANQLLALVVSGKKRATSSSLLSFEAEGTDSPKVGTLSIVTDFSGVPWCVIRTTAVTVMPFKDMTFEICAREGEDECLDTWRKGHQHFFIEEGKDAGFTFSEEMPVLFEDFEVIYSKPASIK